ncbi:MAG: 3-deoxy-D-manno-octulosonic acid transferase, partial [Gammaproteobacteria bacterium]
MKSAVTRILYTLALYLVIPLELIRLYWRGRVSPDYRLRWSERFAINLPEVQKGGIWIHTASVGEFFAALPVIHALLEKHPENTLTVTTMTPTGSEQVRAELGDRVYHIYVPFDLPDAVARFLNHVQPQKLLIMETELWPNLISSANNRGAEIILMNARLSDRSAKGYQYVSSQTRSILRNVSIIAAQHQDDADRFIALGANPSSIRVTGNIKYDLNIQQGMVETGKKLREKFNSELVWIAASTHRGEDEQVIEAHRLVREQYPTAQLILVPRHPERFNEVAAICKNLKVSFSRRSLEQAPDQAVYIGDTMGELLLLFAVADIAFVGGS